MATRREQKLCLVIHAIALTCCTGSNGLSAAVTSLSETFEVSWAPSHVRFLGNGQELQLVLDKSTGAGFASKKSYLYGNIDMQMKLVPGDSAGTVTAYYLSSETSKHDELDFEFLGNASGEPYVLQTNVFSQGVGGREQRIYLWFDPTATFHTYSISWTAGALLFLVDGIPIRSLSNAAGVSYPSTQPMRVFSSLWNGDSWATRGGLVKIDWSHAPFVASYRNFSAANSCVQLPAAAAPTPCNVSWAAATSPDSSATRNSLQWVKTNFMIYDYCSDKSRYPVTPPECPRHR